MKVGKSTFAQLMLVVMLSVTSYNFGSAKEAEKTSWLSTLRARLTKLIPTQENLPFRTISGLYGSMGLLALYKAYQETAHSAWGAVDGRPLSARTLLAYWCLGGTYVWLTSQAYAQALEQEENDDDDYEDYWDTMHQSDVTENTQKEIHYRRLSKKGRLKALGKAVASLGFIWLISPLTLELCRMIATQTGCMASNPCLDHLAIPLISVPALVGQYILYARCLGFSYAKLKEVKTGQAVITEDDNDDEDYYV